MISVFAKRNKSFEIAIVEEVHVFFVYGIYDGNFEAVGAFHQGLLGSSTKEEIIASKEGTEGTMREDNASLERKTSVREPGEDVRNPGKEFIGRKIEKNGT